MFKVGDKVRRINSVYLANQFDGWMCRGNTYTVIRAEPDRIVLKGCPTPDFTWGTQNFELVKDVPKPHVHAELIKAWADGAKIQFHTGNKNDNWEDSTNPMWYENHLYRIKPEPKPDVVMTRYLHNEHGYLLAYANPVSNCPRNEIKYTFDGETGELKDVKLI